MPLNTKLKKVMVIGSGPIVIGQAAEFDYAGTQACRALREEGLEVVLVNSNPATIMTDRSMADEIYIEPLTAETIKRIIEKEKPDSLLSTLGGQTGLTLSMQLAKEGFLASHGVTLLGADPDTIDKAEDRQLFKDTMETIGEPVIPSQVVTAADDAVAFARETGYPVIVRPAFTLGGSGGGIASDETELREISRNGLHRSPIGQILVEKCISGWKEIEFEVIRDGAGNVITVCSMENFDPVGVHTGDSIVIAPTVTLADKEYQMLRSAALNIISALKVEGGCNCQFALRPDSFEYAVIEVNPRVSRSSALASKATGYPIAKVAAKIAVGYRLDEIKNAVTGKTYACFEPALDYVVVKLPKWPFDKFVYAKRTLGTQMKATGEVMAIGTSFEQALMKAVRGAEIAHESLSSKNLKTLSDNEIRDRLSQCTDERLFVVFEAILRGVSVDDIHSVTKIDKWFLAKLANLACMESELSSCRSGRPLTQALYDEAKKLGYPDSVITALTGTVPYSPGFHNAHSGDTSFSANGGNAESQPAVRRWASYKMVDTCAAEFAAVTPYFYSAYDSDNEAAVFGADTGTKGNERKKIIVFGSGPIRIGQGIEFDYASVQCVWSLKKAGYEVIIVNNNPETVSTDFDTADRLYFEPLTGEDVMNIIHTERPDAAVVAFGGQTAIKLTKTLTANDVPILGTPPDSIDAAEDRERFDTLLEKLHIKRPRGYTVMDTEQALRAAEEIGYPVLMRPSYVLGGQNMIIAFNGADIKEYMDIILRQNIENPVLIDKYLMGTEIEIDAICDGEDILIPGIMEHIERTGIHSGDSIAVYPAWNINDILTEKIVAQSRQLALALKTKGLVNIQYLIYHNDVYIIEVNPRSSRTVPYISKVTGVPMVDLAVRAMLGEKLKDMGFGTGLYRLSPYVAVKVPVFSFEKLVDVDTHLGPEMKSTGEVLGIARTLDEALYKGLVAAGYKMKKSGGVLLTVRSTDQYEIADTARRYAELGFRLYATEGTAQTIRDSGMDVTTVNKIHENPADNILTLLESGIIDYVISTSAKGRIPTNDSVRLRRKAVERDIPCLTSIDTANAIADSLKSRYSQQSTELIDINRLRTEKTKMCFVKMQTAGNDFICFDTFTQEIPNPAGLAVRFCRRRYNIGGDGIAVISRSEKADVKMLMFNRDGSEGKMSGNALSCTAKYVLDKNICPGKFGKTEKPSVMTVETASGIRELKLYYRDGKVSSVRINMGKASLEPKSIPVLLPVSTLSPDADAVINVPVVIGGQEYKITCVSMGNPHAVVFCSNVDKIPLETAGPLFENNLIFPERINTEFVRVAGKNILKMRVWERGIGETLACGTGACAAAVAAVENGFCPKGEDITVKIRGGELTVNYTGDTVFLTGSVDLVCEGTVEI